VKLLHLVLSKASPFAFFQLIPTFCSSFSIVLLQVVRLVVTTN
jgi:hypothetical protein